MTFEKFIVKLDELKNIADYDNISEAGKLAKKLLKKRCNHT